MRKNITVIAQMRNDGMVIPLSIKWDDGQTFDISKVCDVKKQASLKGGGMGFRFTCKISGKEKYLWLDGYTWFVEI